MAISAISELSQYLGLNIDSIPDINSYTKHKVLVESDEAENLHWFSLDYKDNDKLIMSFETDWVHPDKVSRITLWTSDLKNDSIYVG